MSTPQKPPVRLSEARTPVPASTETPKAENEAQAGAQRIRLDDLTSNQLDALYDRIEAVRALHKPMQRGGLICAHCSGWDGFRCRSLVQPYPCATLRALDGPPQQNPDTTQETR